MFTLKNIINVLGTRNLNLNLKHLQHLLYNYRDDDWKKYINYSSKTYTRNLIYRNNNYEMYLICWKPNQESKIHNHPSNGCIYKILEGELIETKYDINKINLYESKIIKPDTVGYIDDTIAYHKMSNLSYYNSTSLHIYSPPGVKAKYFK